MKNYEFQKLGFIGCGNMATAMIKGILAKGIVRAADVIGSNSSEVSAQKTQRETGIIVTTDNVRVAEEADIIFLCVKPDRYEPVIKEIRDSVCDTNIIVSITPAKTFQWMEQQFGKEVKAVRTMPNTPCMVGEGLTGVCYNGLVLEKEKEQLEILLNSFGEIVIVPEALMEVVAAAAGSSPAFIYMIIEAMADAAVEAGMPRDNAYRIAAQAVAGSGKMVLETGRHPGELKDAVCSPGGSTIAGVRVLEEHGMRGVIMDALKASIEKAKEM